MKQVMQATKVIEQIPVIVVTGFLGSGKTTLINSLLNHAPKTAVIINEFGTIPIVKICYENIIRPKSHWLVGVCVVKPVMR